MTEIIFPTQQSSKHIDWNLVNFQETCCIHCYALKIPEMTQPASTVGGGVGTKVSWSERISRSVR